MVRKNYYRELKINLRVRFWRNPIEKGQVAKVEGRKKKRVQDS